MAVVYGRCYDEIGPFNDTKYIVGMLERVRPFSILLEIFFSSGSVTSICLLNCSHLYIYSSEIMVDKLQLLCCSFCHKMTL